MDRPPVCQLCRQVHRWVSASGMDKRWKHLSAKPSARLELLMRVVVDYDVDRVQVYSRWRHSRALLIARNFCHPDVLSPPFCWCGVCHDSSSICTDPLHVLSSAPCFRVPSGARCRQPVMHVRYGVVLAFSWVFLMVLSVCLLSEIQDIFRWL